MVSKEFRASIIIGIQLHAVKEEAFIFDHRWILLHNKRSNKVDKIDLLQRSFWHFQYSKFGTKEQKKGMAFWDSNILNMSKALS